MADSPVLRSGFAAPSTPTLRTRRARWKDGRLLLGVLLVAITALAGAKLLSTADDTTAVWAAKRDIPLGVTITSEDLTTMNVRFTSDEAAGQYVAADADLKGLVSIRAISKGEFVPRQAATTKTDSERTELPLSIAAGRLPSDTAVGDHVDVWVVPKDQPAAQLWTKVRVVQIDAVKGVSGSSARRQLLIGLEGKDPNQLPKTLALLNTGEPVVVRRGR
ncbi:SAF domain-containing protein [Kribbella sp. CA-293567]|uniref:SAF domain-containing protein n=1 Tax=Kribbella sp. CA-293567 TaxID=3002436 RepID=UPI0022DD262B|nr:SAF domain-containing protein [Kribbella sp. CA-293567]WBQ03928.1 SAF domain-containing protein [Kribbella sp. CA-293567]